MNFYFLDLLFDLAFQLSFKHLSLDQLFLIYNQCSIYIFNHMKKKLLLYPNELSIKLNLIIFAFAIEIILCVPLFPIWLLGWQVLFPYLFIELFPLFLFCIGLFIKLLPLFL